jgi:Rrf2 family protein
MLSQSAAYALRAVLLLADGPEDGAPVPVERIAADLGAPRNYLSKVLHVLAGTGVVSSKRGPGGGFVLSVAPSELPVARVIAPFESVEGQALCLLGRGGCSDETPCEAHAVWSPVAGEVRRFFERTTVADLMEVSGAAAL